MTAIIPDLPRIDELIKVYRRNERICIFTGAGVSFTQDDRYRAPGWKQLLKDILIELLKGCGRQEAEDVFSTLDSMNHDLWGLASAVKALAKTKEDFLKSFRRAVLKENESVDSYGRLKTRNLRGATTLNAVVAFCSQVRELRKHPCFEVNPKVEAILTSNYDWFLEAGATAKHQAGLFKPMTRQTSRLRQKQLPVYHIHGYLPFGKPEKQNSKHRKLPAISSQPTEPLVLDREDYERAYRSGSWTLDILNHYLGNYTTLFIGFSFEDVYFRCQLRRLAKRPQAPIHFALMCKNSDDPAGLFDEIMESGVHPILYEKHSQVPLILEHVYRSTLNPQGIKISLKGEGDELFVPSAVWRMLWMDKRWKGTDNIDRVKMMAN